MSPDTKRIADLQRRLVHENWYRDVWLLVITIVVLVTVVQAAHLSNSGVVLARRIQANRIDLLHRSCAEQNDRHDQTVRALDRILAHNERHATADHRRQLKASRTATVALIDALVPHRDCRRVLDAARLTH